jgi:hypothetical protein
MPTPRTQAHHFGQFGISKRLRYRMDRSPLRTIEQVDRNEQRIAQSAADQALKRLRQEGVHNDATLPFPWWGKVLFSAIGLIFLVGTGEIIRVESKISGYDIKIGDLGEDIKGLSKKLDSLPQQISKALMSKAASAAASKDFETSMRALDLSSTLLKVGAADRLSSPPVFFKEAIKQLNAIEKEPLAPTEIRLSVHAARQALADYRTSITQFGTAPLKGHPMTDQDAIEAADALGWTVLRAPPGVEQFEFDFKSQGLSNSNYIHGLALVGGEQILDQHARWHDILFMNMRIIYRGGPLDLSNVTFVNCTFDTTPDSSNSAALLEAAALDKRSAIIG